MIKNKKQNFSEITKPLREAAKKSGMKETDVVDIVHSARKNKNRENFAELSRFLREAEKNRRKGCK